MSVYNIHFEGKKYQYKVTSPNTLLITLVQEAAASFGVDSINCQLKLKQKALDLSLPLRFAAIPNHSNLELVAPATSAGLPPQSAVVAQPPPVVVSAASPLAGVVGVPPRSAAPSAPNTKQVVPRPSEAVELLLQHNFDAASKVAVSVLTRYIHNLLCRPDDATVRVINSQNKVFRDKVQAARGAQTVLESAGFVEDSINKRLQFEDTAENRRRAQEAFVALTAAMDELQMAEDERPRLTAPISSPSEIGIPFDPFRSFIVRPAMGAAVVGPDAPNAPVEVVHSGERKARSATDEQLQALRRRRRELEGARGSIGRQTKVLYPGDSPETAVALSVQGDPEPSGPLPRSVLQKTLKALTGDGSSDAPLTTRAVRELQRLQQEKVYREAVLRVRLPDRLQFVGHFHPRDTVADVYLWLHRVCFAQGCDGGDGDDEEWQAEETGTAPPSTEAELRRVAVAQAVFGDVFELYTAPPRTVYAPQRPSGQPLGDVRGEDGESDHNVLSCTLAEVGLVPAAVLNLQWRGGAPPVSAAAATSFAYVHPRLQESATSKTGCADAALRPQGVPLVPADVPARTAAADTAGAGAPDSASEAKKGPTKPKWFKL